MATLVPTSKEAIAAGEWNPKEDFAAALAREEAFLAALSKQRKIGSVVNEVISFPRGDGYAQYVVVSEKPLKLMHLPFGDAWQADPITIRGLRLTDVRFMVARSATLKKLFHPQEVA